MPMSEQSGGEKTVLQQVFLEEKVQLGHNASWSEKGEVQTDLGLTQHHPSLF